MLTLNIRSIYILLSCLLNVSSAADQIQICKIEIIVSVFSAVGTCVLFALCFCLSYSVVKKKKRRQNKATSHKLNNIKGRRNKVFEEDGELKDEDEYSNGRKRQDSGFVASSNESIVPLPEMYATTSPRKSPSMPNLSTSKGGYEQQQSHHEDVFPSTTTSSNLEVNLLHLPRKPKMVSVGVSTDDLLSSVKDELDTNQTSTEDIARKYESVIIQKKSFNCTGIDFGIGGIYVKDIDLKEISFKKGVLSIGDEVLAINDYPVNGLSDMEAFSFFAKSGPDVKLKVIKAGFLAKAEGMSTCSNDFAMSETSSVNEIESSLPAKETTNMKVVVASNNLNRLPRVIVDANNLSHDMSNDLSYKPVQFHNSVFLQKQLSTSSSSSSNNIPMNAFCYHNTINNTESPDAYISSSRHDCAVTDAVQPMPPNANSNGGDGQPHLQSYHDVFGISGQEITRLLVANPGLFVEFLACVKARERVKVDHTSSRCSSDVECCAHSRNVSSEGSKHCRHCSSSEQCQHKKRTSRSETPRHNRNTSSESNSKHSRTSYDEHDNNNSKRFCRSSWDEQPQQQTRAVPYLSAGDGAAGHSQIFTIDSYNKKQPDNTSGLPQAHSVTGDKDYKILKKQNSSDLPYQQVVDSNNAVTTGINQHPVSATNGHAPHLISDNMVVQRGYNNDYIVPVNGNYPNIPTTGYGKSVHRNKDGSPGRRMSPVVFTTQTVPRFPAGANVVNTEVTSIVSSDYRQHQTQLSNSPQSSMSGLMVQNGSHARKPPPEYGSATRPSNDQLAETSNREYDQEFMRKMTQKYSEPRFRKDPPPYSSFSHTLQLSGGDKTVPSSDNIVVLRRRSDDRPKTGQRSRPHSYTETGILGVSGISDDGVIHTQIKAHKNDEKRKHPKRTHSMPAVKYAEMRPVAAQAFLSINDPSIPQQQQHQQQQHQQQYLQQQLEQKLHEQRLLEQQLLEQKQQQQKLQHHQKQQMQHQQQIHQQQQQQQQQQQMLEQQRQQKIQQQNFLEQQLIEQQRHQQMHQQQQRLEQHMLEQQMLEQQQQQQQQQHHLLEQQMLEQHQQHSQQENDQQLNPNNTMDQTPKKLRMRQRAQDNINRRKSIDSGTLRQLAEEMKENPSLGGEFPIISQLLGESQMAAMERRQQGLYRYKSTEALYSQF